jgi:hypothetical protein
VLCLTAAVCSCSAAGFGPASAWPGEITLVQSLQLWIPVSDEWEARLEGDPVLRHRIAGGEWHKAGSSFAGKGSAGQVLTWDLGVDPGWAAPRLYIWRGVLHLHGTPGLVWLESDHFQVLPLNSHEFTVFGTDGLTHLRPGEWYVFPEPVEIRWRDAVAPIRGSVASKMSALGEQPQASGAAWLQGSVSLDAGESALLTLRLTGPSPAGILSITLPQQLILQEPWKASTGWIEQWFDGAWNMNIPELGFGEVLEITGIAIAALPHQETWLAVRASWHGALVDLPVFIGRGWFTEPPRLSLTAFSQGEPVPGAEFVFVDGARESTGASGKLWARVKPGLQPVFPVGDPKNPLWVTAMAGLPLAVEAEAVERAQGQAGIFGGVLVGSDGSQAFVHGPGFSIHSEDGACHGELAVGPWQGEMGQGKFAVRWRGPSETYQDGSWVWQGRGDGWRGHYRAERLRLGVELGIGHVPRIQILLDEAGIGAAFSGRRVTVRWANEHIGVGADWGNSRAWITWKPHNLRFSASPRGWRVQHHTPEGTLSLSLDREGSTRFDAAWEHLRVFIQGSHKEFQWGMAVLGEGWAGAMHVVNTHYVVELRRGQLVPLSEGLALFGQASLQLQPHGLSSRWVAGLQLTPLPWLGGMASYDSHDGIRWQLGVTFSL